MAEQIIKVTSKGQLTLPARIREHAGVAAGTHLYVKAFGRLVLMRKVDDLSLDEISQVLETVAAEKGVTRALLGREIERTRARLWKRRDAKVVCAA
jgi:AbrB family looped-hinge helix DNA binding protein